MEKGSRVSWKSVNGIRSGIVEDGHPLGWIVRLDNGKFVIVEENSVIR